MKHKIVSLVAFLLMTLSFFSCIKEELYIKGDKVTKGNQCWLADPFVNCHYSQCWVDYTLTDSTTVFIYVVCSENAVGKTVTCSFNGKPADTLYVSDIDNRMFVYPLEKKTGRQTFDVFIPDYGWSHMYVNTTYKPWL